MDAVLFTLTLLSLVIPGWASVMLIGPRHARLGWPEVLPLAFLLGAALVTLLSFGLGFVVAGAWLRGMVTALGVLFSLAVFSRQRSKLNAQSGKTTPRIISRYTALFSALLAAQASVVAWLAWRGTLEWDGLVVWEAKAYLACLNDGRVPLAYFADPARQWSHPQYPLFVPLLEAWLYGWLGRCDQSLAGLLFPLFYLAAAGLLVVGGLRLGKSLGRGMAASLLLFCVPQLVVGAGSAASGYADFPLAVVYLGAVVYLADYALTQEPGSLRLAAALALCLPWIKQEGVVLAVCFLALAGVLLWQRRQGRGNLLLVPAVLALPLCWAGFLAWQGAPRSQDFLPFTLATLDAHLDRLGTIVGAVVDDLKSQEQWGLLWPALPVAALLLALRRDRPPFLLLGLTIALPMTLYAATYLFSAWVPYSLHIASSLPRLLSHVAPLAVLLLGLAMPVQTSAPTTPIEIGVSEPSGDRPPSQASLPLAQVDARSQNRQPRRQSTGLERLWTGKA